MHTHATLWERYYITSVLNYVYHLGGAEYCTAVPTKSFNLIKGIPWYLVNQVKISESYSAPSFSTTQSPKSVDLMYEMSSPFHPLFTYTSLKALNIPHTPHPANVLDPHILPSLRSPRVQSADVKRLIVDRPELRPQPWLFFLLKWDGYTYIP